MDMFFLFIASVIGMTHIIVDSTIFEPVKNFIKDYVPNKVYSALNCYQCSGTWCGFLCGWAIVSNNFFIIIMCGFAGSFLAVLGASVLNYLDSKAYVDLEG